MIAKSFEWSSSESGEETAISSKAVDHAALEVELIVEDDSWLQVSDDFEFLKKAAFLALAQQDNQQNIQLTKRQQGEETAHPAIKSPHRLAVIMLSDNRKIRDLNNTYRGKDQATNVLSFPENEDEAALFQQGDTPEAQHIGDVILAYKYVVNEAKTENKPLKTHISHLIIHGVLHLLGYDHETTTEANTMESLEIALMHQLGYPNPYEAEIT